MNELWMRISRLGDCCADCIHIAMLWCVLRLLIPKHLATRQQYTLSCDPSPPRSFSDRQHICCITQYCWIRWIYQRKPDELPATQQYTLQYHRRSSHVLNIEVHQELATRWELLFDQQHHTTSTSWTGSMLCTPLKAPRSCCKVAEIECGTSSETFHPLEEDSQHNKCTKTILCIESVPVDHPHFDVPWHTYVASVSFVATELTLGPLCCHSHQ